MGTDETDCAFWDKWVKENPSQAPEAYLAAAMVAGLGSSVHTLSYAEIAFEWNKLQARIKSTPAREPKQIWVFNWRTVAAAASVLVVLGFLGVWFMNSPVTAEYTTALGQKKNIQLEDGTIINLNVNSVLRTTAKNRFSPAREIWLEGEAFFKVVSHKTDASLSKFVVHTPGLDVTVVGTQFNVKARNKKTHVFLNEGKVRVTMTENPALDSLVLLPGDFVSFEPAAATTRKVNLKKQDKFIRSWRDGYYTFNKTPLADVFDLVESTEDFHLSVDDDRYLQEPLSGKIASGNVTGLCNSIANLYQLEYTRTGNQIRFSARKPEHGPPKP